MATVVTGLHGVTSAFSASRLSSVLLRRRVLSRALGRAAVACPPALEETSTDDVRRPPLSSAHGARLRRAWFARSIRTSWTFAEDWWHPACDQVVECLVAGQDVGDAVRRLGRARGGLGVPVEETIDDLLALWHVHTRGEPPSRVVQSVAAGWAEAGLGAAGAAGCFDVVTGLTTRSHLEARLAELYRTRSRDAPDVRYALVVLDVGPAVPTPAPARLGEQPWDDARGLYRAAEAMRRVFCHGQVLTRLAAARVSALAEAGPDLTRQLGALDALLAAGAGPDLAPSVWVEPLPRTFGLVPQLLTDLAR